MSRNTGRYRKISVKMWGDDKFCTLSRPKPNAQTLWVYLLTGPHTVALPCAFQTGEASLAEAIDWPLSAFRKCFAEVLGKGMAQADWKARLVFVPNALRYNPPESPNVVKGWRSAFNELPECSLKEHVFSSVKLYLETEDIGQGFAQAFGEAYVYRSKQSEQEQNKSRTGTRAETDREGGSVPHSGLLLVFGEFGWVKLTQEQYDNLGRKLTGYTEQFIADFDRWVQEAPAAKHRGVCRKDRDPYASILSWFDRKKREGRLDGQYESKEQAKVRRNLEAARGAFDFMHDEAGDGAWGGDHEGEGDSIQEATGGPLRLADKAGV